MLAQHARASGKAMPTWVLGLGFAEAGSFVQSRMSGAFEGIRERLPQFPLRISSRSKAAACASRVARRNRVPRAPPQGGANLGRRVH